MAKAQEPKTLTPEKKQYTVLPNEADPKFSLPKAMSAALKAKSIAKKVRKPKF